MWRGKKDGGKKREKSYDNKKHIPSRGKEYQIKEKENRPGTQAGRQARRLASTQLAVWPLVGVVG